MSVSKSVSELTNKLVPALTDKIYLSDSATSPPTDKYTTVSQLLGTTAIYKKYVALMSQSGTSAPTVVILDNSIGSIVWSYVGIGRYDATLTGAFTVSKTALFISPIAVGGSGAGVGDVKDIFFVRDSANVVRIITMNPGAGYQDSILSDTTIEIRVYS